MGRNFKGCALGLAGSVTVFRCGVWCHFMRGDGYRLWGWCYRLWEGVIVFWIVWGFFTIFSKFWSAHPTRLWIRGIRSKPMGVREWPSTWQRDL